MVLVLYPGGGVGEGRSHAREEGYLRDDSVGIQLSANRGENSRRIAAPAPSTETHNLTSLLVQQRVEVVEAARSEQKDK